MTTARPRRRWAPRPMVRSALALHDQGMIVDERPRTAERHPAPAGSLPAPVREDVPRQLTKDRPAVTPAAPPVDRTQASIAIDRWANEGGRIYDGDRTLSRAAGRARPASPAVAGAARPHVMIAGAGVAGLETLLATRLLVGDRLDISLLAPEWAFADHSAAVRRPFEVSRADALRLADVARDLGARWHRTAIDRVDHDQHRVVTTDGDQLGYDHLVLAVGARGGRGWQSDEVLTFGATGGGACNSYPVLLHQLRIQQIKHIAFVRPSGASWPTPMYDLALLTAAFCAAHDLREVELALLTPEHRPLAIFGASVSATIRLALDEAGVTLHTDSTALSCGRGWLATSPGRAMRVDRVVTQPRLIGPRLRGLPCGPDGFIVIEPSGHVAGVDDVYAAGDATDSPIKHCDLAAEQADAVAATLALSAVCGAGQGSLTSVGDRASADVQPHRDPRPPARDATSRLQRWSAPDVLGVRHLAPYRHGPCGDILRCSPHAIDIMRERVPPGSWRRCLDPLDLAVR